MNSGMRIAGAVVGGYVLGRRRKAKLAITVGAWIAGKKLNLSPQKLLTDLAQELGSSPELSELRDQVRNELVGEGKSMATTAVTQQAGKWTQSLQERTDQLQHGANSDEPSEEPAKQQATKSADTTSSGKGGRQRSGTTRKSGARSGAKQATARNQR